MNIRELLLQYWDNSMEQEDWYPPLGPALKEVTLEQAVWKPGMGAANSIWENVQHLLYYKERILGRMTDPDGLPAHIGNEETFLIPEISEQAWEEARTKLEQLHAQLRSQLERMPEDELEREPERFQSLITHDAYHTGQIVLLRKLQGSWPATRSYS